MLPTVAGKSILMQRKSEEPRRPGLQQIMLSLEDAGNGSEWLLPLEGASILFQCYFFSWAVDCLLGVHLIVLYELHLPLLTTF